MNKVTKNWCCAKGHRLVAFKSGFRRLANGKLDKRPRVNCSHCKIDFEMKNGYSSCLQGCDTYMCPRCSLCKLKHVNKWAIGGLLSTIVPMSLTFTVTFALARLRKPSWTKASIGVTLTVATTMSVPTASSLRQNL